jgi:hypothetical protein
MTTCLKNWHKNFQIDLTEKIREIFLAAQLCYSLKLSHVTFKGDSLTVTLAINNSKIVQDRKISSIISDFSTTIPSTTSWLARHINQNANICAHHVANWAATRFAFPPFLYLLIPFLYLLKRITHFSFRVP